MAARPTTRAVRAGGEAGFTLVEQLVSVTLLVGVLIALMGALGSSTAGVVAGRQRTIATSLGRESVERVQGGGYANAVMNLSSPGLASDIRVSGTSPSLSFDGEPLVGGGSHDFRTQEVQAGVTYTVSTYVTSVAPPNVQPYRRITVFVDWAPPGMTTMRSQRFSSLVFPLDYATLPAGSGSAEVTPSVAGVLGSLGSDTFEDVRVLLPAAQATTSASTLRTSHGTGSGPFGTVSVAAGPLSTSRCAGGGTARAECPAVAVDRLGDNDAGTAAATWLGGSPSLYSAATVTTPGGATFTLPSGDADSHASVAACGSCGFGDGDGVPHADGRAATSAAMSGTFAAGGVSGSFWRAESAWKASTTVDHDTVGSGMVTGSAELEAPAVKVLTVDGVAGFDGAVKVPAFTITAAASAGDAPTPPTVTGSLGSVPVQIRDGNSYRTVNVTPGVAVDSSATATVVAGDTTTVALASRVQSQAQAISSAGSFPRTAAVAQQPSVLLITVTATFTGAVTGSVTATFDYGVVTARGDWRVTA